MTPVQRILAALSELERLYRHPAVDPCVAERIAKTRAAIARDPAEAREVFQWFGGMGSFWDNEYLNVLDLTDDEPDRRAAWARACEEHHRWTVEQCRQFLEIARALKELGHDSPHLRAAPTLLEPALQAAFRPPDEAEILRLEGELRRRELRRRGFARLPPALLRRRLAGPGWDAFARSWSRLEIDPYMADRGRYRRRRHAVYAVAADGGITREKRQPHYQSLEYNPLHGGIERWLDPIEGEPAPLTAVIRFCLDVFGRGSWRVEAHQFRIEARAGEPGKPTPEGMHRDGVDFVLVLLVRRENIESGTTTIRDEKTGRESSFTLTEPFDAVLVDDARVRHGVTPVEPVDPSKPACRDVLVVTLKRA